jgi:hypothetical protein
LANLSSALSAEPANSLQSNPDYQLYLADHLRRHPDHPDYSKFLEEHPEEDPSKPEYQSWLRGCPDPDVMNNVNNPHNRAWLTENPGAFGGW